VRIGIALPIDLARQASRNEVANWLRSRLRFDRKLPAPLGWLHPCLALPQIWFRRTYSAVYTYEPT
jgi:hypothetical protein